MLKLVLIGVVVGLVGFGAANVVPRVLRPAAPTPPPRATAAPRLAAEQPTPGTGIERRIALFAQNLQEGRPASLDLSEAEAAATAKTMLERCGEERVHDLKVRFTNGTIEAHATLTTPVGDVPVVAVLKPIVASDGVVDVRVEGVRLAGAAPPFVEAAARSLIEEQLAQRISQPEWMAIQRLEVADGLLTLDALPKRR